MSKADLRSGYLTVDALVALVIATTAIGAAVALASTTVLRLAQARDRLEASRLAGNLYEDLYAGERPDGRYQGQSGGRRWSYATQSASTATIRSSARRGRIVVERRHDKDLAIDVVLPPVPATPSSN